uniref:tRNA(Ile)-lysidine synthase, chloroplastic n=1 Tax=Polysiphonia sertularioides TaxID=945028 RepID=A0A1Z1M9D1_9FLOR|nr:tRNA Ile-lysidine synthetase [Polysiphonia sertularioides]ARW62431.1 tRNA Ile-lysidine synthetase [Polysiphonia sertularioides]
MLKNVENAVLELTNNFLYKSRTLKILVSISGGQDSLLLMKILNKVAKQYNENLIITYIYIDHQWKENSYKQIEHINNYIKSLKSKLIIYQINESTISEKECRIQRYHIIHEHAIKYSYHLIITGHHFDDKIETFFQNINRGSGIEGLSSPVIYNNLSKKIFIAKPLLSINKENIYWLCKKLFLPIWSDSTNYIYIIKRNRIRYELIPYLSSFLSQQVKTNIINLMQNYYYENEYIKQNVNKLYLTNKHDSKIAINYKNIIKQHPILQIRTIQMFCLQNLKTYFKNKKIIGIVYNINQMCVKKK